ncbi:MAG: SIS domain-containing protein, partial [Desulfurococcaceae archaeon]
AIKGSSRKILGLVDRLLPARSMYYLSRDIGLPIAREGALKVKEIAYVHAEAYPAGESKHGPIALVEQGFPVVFIVPPDSGIEQKILGNIEEMKARGAFTIGVVHEGSSLNNVVEFPLEVPRAHWITTPITHTPPLQLLAYHLAVKKGHDPDKPRNLAKTVTVE